MDQTNDGHPALRTVLLTSITMVAFASNSLLCRLALQHAAIDAASFSSIRLVSGAVVLAVLARASAGRAAPARVDWAAATMLFLYVAFFSFAYLTLSAGTGALILFGAVQLTMLAAGLRAGERFDALGWAGFALAAGGLVYLVSPGVTAPTPLGAALMTVAGVAWGVYSLRGRGLDNPLAATASNFLRAAPMALALSLLLYGRAHASPAGILLALAAGALTSGIGYVLWYAALKGLSAIRAAAVQLSVPPIAAFGAVLFLAEPLTPRLAAASAAILGGIALVLASRTQRKRVEAASQG
ncbi:DMT family transporter [Ralstonia sp. NFACC01]|jgi:drug/metabolite transporter (DMT)-like permease|uniref:DMT family transporter n=1 Tax=Ralstonia sp. NFACC01 TaxID=1566294 RepID=UPI0008E90651|nr:DMT family transporter [Ralstonia sp. NFACC01]SFQ14323.1 Threonine/homoserine efflux transporter RhtA [Ralstonia sp. NFACC01]